MTTLGTAHTGSWERIDATQFRPQQAAMRENSLDTNPTSVVTNLLDVEGALALTLQAGTDFATTEGAASGVHICFV